MTHKDKALSLFSQGFHCSQAVLGAFAEELGISDELALSVSGSFGGGMRNGEVCGACTGALMAIGLKYRFFKADDIGSKEKNGSFLCRELLGYDLSDPKQQAEAREKCMFTEFCPKMVASAVETAEELMNK